MTIITNEIDFSGLSLETIETTNQWLITLPELLLKQKVWQCQFKINASIEKMIEFRNLCRKR
jgi:hypothetical protein